MNIKINKEYVDSMIIGSLLGDASIDMDTDKYGNRFPYTISFTQCYSKESNYIAHKHELMSKYYNPLKLDPAHNNTIRFRMSRKDKYMIEEMFHLVRTPENKRIFPDIKYFNPIVLLYWYLDDGSLALGKQTRPNRKSSIYRKLRIALKLFDDEDILTTTEGINKKFGLKFKPSYEQNKIVNICISNNIEEISKFLELLYPYKQLIPEEMYFKFCLAYHKTMMLDNKKYEKYNICKFHKTGICTCRDKDYSDILI